MKTYILVAIAILILGGFASAQSRQKISIQTGETKSVIGSKINVKFLSVIDDSRCPKGTTCIWAGNAKVSIRVWKKNGKSVDLELNSTLDPRSAEYFGYRITLLDLSPKTTATDLDANRPQKDETPSTGVFEIVKL